MVLSSLNFQYVYAASEINSEEGVFANTMVDGNNNETASTIADAAFPELNRATINGTILTLHFNKELDQRRIPSIGDFSIKVQKESTENQETSMYLVSEDTNIIHPDSGEELYQISPDVNALPFHQLIEISEVSIYENKAVLTLTGAVASTNIVTIDYTPGEGRDHLCDQAGNDVNSFSDYFVENITGGTSLPDFVVEAIYNELDTSSLSDTLARKVYYAMLEYVGSKEELFSVSNEMINILQSSGTYSGLTDENKSKLCSFFGISNLFFNYSEGKGESIEEAILIYFKMMGFGMAEDEIAEVISNDVRDEVIAAKDQEQSDQINNKSQLRAAGDDETFDEVKYDNKKTLSAPFRHTDSSSEQIDMGSGTLDYHATDVVLPGAGGLDLMIEREYSTERAKYYLINASLKYATSSSATPKYSYMNAYERERFYTKNADGTIGDYLQRNDYELLEEGNLIGPYALRGYYNMAEIADLGSRLSAHFYKKEMTTSLTNYMSAKHTTWPVTENEKMWQMGAGWKFNFSYIDINTFDFNYMKLYLSDGREFGISPNWVNNLGHYTYQDVIFAIETKTVAGQTSNYNVTYTDGKKEYFNSGGRLIAIVDRFGNTISFTYTTVNNMTDIKITDTLGRITTITNESTGSGYNKIVKLPDGKRITYVIQHNTARTLDVFDRNEDYAGQHNEYNLVKVINQKGEETTYSYTDTRGGDDFGARFKLTSTKKFMTPDQFGDEVEYFPNYYAALTKITYPTGLTVNYEYYLSVNNWYDYGCTVDLAMKNRYDQQGSKKYNQKNYEYSYRYKKNGEFWDYLYKADGYSNERSEDKPFEEGSDWWVREVDLDRNLTTQYYFGWPKGYCFQIKTYSGSKLIETVAPVYREFNLDKYLSKTKVTTNRYDTSSGQVLTTIECYDYDNKGNVTSYWPALAEGNTSNTEYKISMSYHNLYNYLTGKTYKRDTATTINEQNLPSGDGKTIAQALVYENGTLKAKSDYVYDTFGNVTKSKVYTNLSTGAYSETDYGYTNGTYLTKITILNVINADGTNLGSISRQATHDIYGRILTETDAKGNVTSYTYDDIGRVTKVTYPGSVTKSFAYNTPSNQTTITDERGFVTRYQYDMAGNLTAVYSVNGSAATLMKANEYDSANRLIKEQNNLAEGGGITAYSYDHKDRITQKSGKNASGQTLYQENNTYFDDKTTKTVAGDTSSKAIVTTEYPDKYGRVTKQGRFVDGTERFNTFAYNYLGEKLQEKSARANAEGFTEPFTTKYEYDFAGNVKKQYDVLGNFITTAYDAAGRKVSVTDPKSNASGGSYSTLSTYDALGRLVKEETPFAASSASITKYYYDANGNLTQKQVTNNQPGSAAAFTKVEYSYDNRDRLVQVKSYNGASIANQVDYEYDAAGNMTAMTTGSGTQRTTYGYDRYGNMTSLTDPLGMKETYAYNINGNMTAKTDKNGQVTNYTYDGLARKLSQAVTANGTEQTETFGHTATGALAFAQNSNIRTDYTYDEAGRLIKELESNGVEKTYTYDVNGNLKTSVVKVNGSVKKTMSFVYDKKDRLSQISENGTLIATYTYDANGNRSTLTYGNGNSVGYAYNLANLVTSLQNKKGTGVLSSYAYTYYLDGNQATKTDHTGRLTSYAYDGLGRLTQEAESGASGAITKAYTFDTAGNRANLSVSGAESYTVGYAYDLNNRLKTETKEAGTTTDVTDYYYDNNGNTIAKRTGTLKDSNGSETPALDLNMAGAELYSYDGFDRMTRYQDASGTSSYTYKPDGLRLSKTVNGATTTHVWEGNQISLELDGSGAVTNRYLRGLGLIKSDNNGWYLFNGHGDVVQLADGTGAVTKEYAYDAFGNEKNINPSDTNPFRYTGEYFDKESGSVYLRARYYDPTTGRFLSEDTYNGKATDPLSLNLYTYCENDPVNFTDPSGKAKYSSKVKTRLATENDKKLKAEKERLELKKVESAIEQAKFLLKIQGANPSDRNYESLLINTAIQQYEMNEQAMNAVMGMTVGVTKITGAVKKVPNPFGKNGGLLHQNKIKDISNLFKENGFNVTLEKYIETPGGYKNARFGDILIKDPKTGEQLIIQVGKQTKGGNPVSREVKAIIDLSNAGYKVLFVPYN